MATRPRNCCTVVRPRIVDARDDKDDTALIVAIGNGDDRLTGFLFEKGADPNLAGYEGGDPADRRRARIGSSEAAGWLLEIGAKSTANRLGGTPLIIAVQLREIAIVSPCWSWRQPGQDRFPPRAFRPGIMPSATTGRATSWR